MQRPWLSVVMPTHDGERWIGRALQSLADVPGIECIVIDSSEQPGTLAIARQFADRVPIRALHRRDLLSWTAKTNAGVALAQAAHVCMLHQDDCWLPGRAPALRRWIAGEPGRAVWLNPSALIDERDRSLGPWRCPLPAGTTTGPDLFRRLLVQNFIAVPAPVFPRQAYLDVGGMDTALWYTADWDLYLKLSQVCAFHYHPAALTAFRVHGGSQTVLGSRDIDDFGEQMTLVLRRHAGALRSADRARVLDVAAASIAMNVALAAAIHGDWRRLAAATAGLLRLGPADVLRYLRDSRLAERAVPRIKARLSGRFVPHHLARLSPAGGAPAVPGFSGRFAANAERRATT